MKVALPLLAAAYLTLSACGGSSSANSPATPATGTPSGGGNGQTEAPVNRFAASKGCYALQSPETGQFAVATADGYTLSTAELDSAEGFYMQPSNLGTYLLYTKDEKLLTANTGLTNAGTVTANDAASDDAIWALDISGDNASFIAENSGQQLQVNDNGELVIGEPGSEPNTLFALVPSSGCATYPEMPTGIIGDTYKGQGVNKPIVGFADVHTHMGMSSEMSYAGDVGPSAGGVLYGEVIHRFGVPHALEDCEDFHGPNGSRDANFILDQSTAGGHDTQGWPTFVDWPRRNYLTHQVMYYRWVERAYLAGLRLMVNHGTNIAALCRVGQSYAGRPDADCDDMGVAVKQVQYLYDVQDYIDAQHGGPGKGWYRIVKSPMEAREVINDGKLAVILGVEVAQVLSCGVTFNPDGSETRKCDQDQVDSEIQRLWDLGVRHIYPYHDIDSSLGGTGIFNGSTMNFLNYMDTGRFMTTSECREYPTDEPAVRTPGAEMATAIPGTGSDPLTQAIIESTQGATPTYPPGRRCNARTVTDLGAYTLNTLMDRGMVIDIDHAAYHSKDIMLDIAEQRTPAYPMASSHDAHGGLTSDQAVRMLKAGGTIYPYKGNGIKHVEFMEKLKFWREKAGVNTTQVMGLGYGADANGFGGHPGPRGGDSEPVSYPFTLFSGDGWGPQFNNIKPVTVEMLTIPESGKFWHIDETGMSHYGLVADFVEEVRLEGGQEAIDALFNSAEAYVQMWERAYYSANPAP